MKVASEGLMLPRANGRQAGNEVDRYRVRILQNRIHGVPQPLTEIHAATRLRVAIQLLLDDISPAEPKLASIHGTTVIDERDGYDVIVTERVPRLEFTNRHVFVFKE